MAWELDQHDELPYRFSLPPGYDPSRRQYPVVVYLHGSAERGSDTVAQLKNGVDALLGQHLIAVAPQCPMNDTFGGSWYGGESRTQRHVVELVKSLAHRRSVDAHRISVIGYSMGGIGLWDLLVRHRALFSAGVPIASDLDLSTAKALEGFPLWAFHGERDDLVPNTQVRAVAKLLPPPFRYTELPGVGHDSWRKAFANPELLPWLLAQRSA
ncbi:MAG: dienelactone hydrolase family protein [Archangiaceae bacterium]|nr:dienelactone hydrolase family protein [Archangiaceae bacterium]